MTLDKDIKDIEREFEKLANLEIRVIIPVDDLLKEAFESSNIQKVRTAISKAKSKGLNETQRKIITSGLENFVYKTNYVCHSFSNREFLVKELVSLKPDNTNYLFKLAEVYRGESVDKEKQLLYKILCLDSNNSGAKNRLYELLINKAREAESKSYTLDTAIKLYKEILEIQVDSYRATEIKEKLAKLYVRNDDFDKAEKLIESKCGSAKEKIDKLISLFESRPYDERDEWAESKLVDKISKMGMSINSFGEQEKIFEKINRMKGRKISSQFRKFAEEIANEYKKQAQKFYDEANEIDTSREPTSSLDKFFGGSINVQATKRYTELYNKGNRLLEKSRSIMMNYM